jgi:hypothetical protein
MKYLLLFLVLALGGKQVWAHEFTPAYPTLERSYMDGILVTKMLLFNRRNDVKYYELSVFDSEWNPVSFATTDKIVEVKYLERKYIDIFIREKDRSKAVYICSKSMLQPDGNKLTVVSSRICSKIK